MKQHSYWIDDNLNFRWARRLRKVDLDDSRELYSQENCWREYLASNTPMGNLLETNSLFETIRGKKGLMILHLTPNMKEIKKSKKIYSSGGGLGACVYGVPLRNNQKLHNLASFIYEYELPIFLRSQQKKVNIDVLAIRIPNEDLNSINSIKKVNYLDWGNYYLQAFLCTEVRHNDVINLKMKTEIKNVQKYILPFQDLTFLRNMSPKEFLLLFNEAISNFPTLRVPYFETVLEYLFLFQDSKMALQYKKVGEIYNPSVKKLIFDVNTRLQEKFSLNYFDTLLERLAKHIKKGGFVQSFSEIRFYNFIRWRFSHNIRFHIMQRHLLPLTLLSFDEILTHSPSLLGYILFRNFRNQLNLEENLSKLLWSQWKKDGTKILTYSNLPKGEIGILPSVSKKTRIYSARIQNGTAVLEKELDIKIVERLINSEITIMRSPESEAN